MADDKITKILDIQVKYKDAIKAMQEYSLASEEAKRRIADLKKERKEGIITEEEYHRQLQIEKVALTEINDKLRRVTKEMQNNVREEQYMEGSLVGLRAQLSKLTKEYDEMSRAERESAAGEALRDHINAVTKEIKDAEFATQRFYRNVGNYENSVKAALASMTEEIKKAQEAYDKAVQEQGEMSDAAEEAKQHLEGLQWVMDFTTESSNKMMASIIPLGDKIVPMLSRGLSGVKEAFHLAGQGAQILGKQFLALMANPIVAFLGILAAAITLVVQGIKGSEENMNQWNRIMAPVTRALTGLRNVVEILCGWILNVVEAGGRLLFVLGNIVEWATSGIPVVGIAIHGAMEATREAIDLEQREQKLTQDRRKAIVEEAKAQNEIAKLREKSADASNKDINERLAANKKAIEMELQISKERERMAKEELAIAQAKAAQAGNSAADNEELARLEAAVYQAETEYYQKTKRMQSEQNTLEKQIADEKKKRAEESARIAKDRSDKEQAAVRAAEDAMLSLVKETGEKRRTEINRQYQREIDDLKKRLSTESNLSPVARDAINKTIEAKEKQRAQDLADLEMQLSDEAIQRKQEEVNLRLEIVKKGADEEYELRRQQNELSMQQELSSAEQSITNKEELERRKMLITEKYAAIEQQMQIEQQKKVEEQEKLAMQNRFTELLMQAETNDVEKAAIEVERRKTELDALHQMEDETIEEFRARRLEKERAYKEAQQQLVEQENKVTQSKLQAAESVTGGISKALNALGEENKAFAKASKVLALAEIAINTGKAIAAGTAQAQSVPFPGNIAAIATTVATVLANIASAISTVKSAKFATGVVNLQGAGTSTSDSIPARLSRGESVMTAKATQMFGGLLTIMNDMATQPQYTLPTTYRAAERMENNSNQVENMRIAIEELHPVVSVEEITRVANRVSAIDRLDTL